MIVKRVITTCLEVEAVDAVDAVAVAVDAEGSRRKSSRLAASNDNAAAAAAAVALVLLPANEAATANAVAVDAANRQGEQASWNGRLNSSGTGRGMNPNSHDNGPHHTGNFVTSLLLTADKLDRVRVKEECPGLFVEFLTNWNEKGGNTESKPGNGLATTTIETFAEVVGKMMGRKELPVNEFVKS